MSRGVGGYARAMAVAVRNNPTQHRYELLLDDTLVGIADYREEGDVLVFPHTEISPQRRGQGLGEQLVKGALDDVRQQKKTVRPLCSFVSDFFRHNPDYADLRN